MRRYRVVLASLIMAIAGIPSLGFAAPSVTVAAPSCQTVTLSVRWEAEPRSGTSGWSFRQTTYFKVGVFTQNGQDYNVCTSPVLTQYNLNTGLQNYFIKGITYTVSRRASDYALQVTMEGWAQGIVDAYWVTQRMTFKNFTATQYNYIYDHAHESSACHWRFLSQSTFRACGVSSTMSVSVPF